MKTRVMHLDLAEPEPKQQIAVGWKNLAVHQVGKQK
jgi:hypothetical protein